MSKWVYTFGDGKAEGNATMRNLLGGKGANLAEMSSIGVPVPPGFTITTEACTYYYQNNKAYSEELKQQVMDGLRGVEAVMGKKFGDAENPSNLRKQRLLRDTFFIRNLHCLDAYFFTGFEFVSDIRLRRRIMPHYDYGQFGCTSAF